ncbi:MAG TPA: hypothetical protein VM802_24075 [Chitinophaga sp.]|uniref:hypothetical protein n=1 Tax=Chitinophaga sp. TaxID=1869181 RepID=UPI002C0620C5|nr:hypothetical protein [Chitinophaga sp.]HVI47967.1 hypothetical protein [Chitinophaga sp.]
MNFQTKYADRLFIAESQPGDRGFIAFVVPETATPPDRSISLQEALEENAWSGSFVFSAQTPVINDKSSADDFLLKIYGIIGTSRMFIWMPDPAAILPETVFSAPFSGNANAFTFKKALNIIITPSLTFVVNSGIQIKVDPDGSALIFDGNNDYEMQFSGPSKPDMKQVMLAQIPCVGGLRGCIQFTGYIQHASLFTALQWGFQFLIPNPDTSDPDRPTLSEWLPFADPINGPTEYFGFNISIDPCDPFNTVFDPCKDNNCPITDAYASRRTFFDFTGKDFLDNPITLTSYFITAFGENLVLIPGNKDNATFNARLVFSLSDRSARPYEDFHLSPEGDFIMSLPNSNNSNNHYVICGMSGTEFFKITPHTTTQKGDIIRFISRKPVYVPGFPFASASPVAAPCDYNASPFTNTYYSSWVTMVNNSGNRIYYVSQPKGSAFYGIDTLIEPNFNDLLGHSTQGFIFTANDTTFFPMVPYSGVVSKGVQLSAIDVNNLEQSVISPQRRLIITSRTTNCSASQPDQSDTVTKYDTTPSGLIVKTSQTLDGCIISWEEVLLGWNIDRGTRYNLSFIKPLPALVNALQSSDVFLVAANNKNIGNFQDTISIGDWKMKANIGLNQQYGDYKNIMIIKGRRGKLYDPVQPANGLISNPLKWTQTNDFSIPTTQTAGGDGTYKEDPSQLVILSQWLQTYFDNARLQAGNPYFEKFNNIATSDNWTGILFLRVDITDIPYNLKGIMAGVTDPDAFNAHHFGIEINPVTKGSKGPQIDQPSSVFGLIYYVDPDFADVQPVKTIAPSSNATYNYRLLSLKVLFENTIVKNFESYAQLTLNKVFNTTVTGMYDPDNIYRNILLSGSLQINNGNPVYSLGSKQDEAFTLDSNIIRKVEITNVMLSTRSSGDKNKMVSWFAMSGFIDFYCLQDDAAKTPFDIFSFGNKPGENYLKKGLSFSNMGIKMIFSTADPADSALNFDLSEITFDPSISTPRENCLYSNMLLDLESLVTGQEGATPKETGYLDVIPDIRFGGVAGSQWYGLRMKLNMGTPGELAGKINLNSYLLLSWSPDSNLQNGYKANVGISLPGTGGGAKLISLQNVMKLSIGQIRLMYIKDKTSFLLLFTEIALKFLGLLKIPSGGNTLFYLFGNPHAGGKASGLGWYAMYAKEEKKSEAVTIQ